ncbi:MAG: C45 family autoproteolytic acyltransferase/hydrolase [Phreatobacter sp.]|uniref:C45 family autoproteolytic acyltransferase/hydolase n=1 Tax=Phreatobacter sp. TaxID=1966341 RepID=UPI002732912A|nr:C45 family autoproteolytic acyltransferase/hydolase [Phreatobacter sp.]MDP2804073.1 C45 family autoproteolytic acyltransferase/hydrolase [Phreatobacter sp.]
MQKRFVAEREDQPGDAWLARFIAGRDETERWYLGQGLEAPPTARECRAALQRYMPELVPQYDRVCTLAGDDDLAHRILSHYRPPPVFHGCSIAVWLDDDGPAVVRNYDFPLHIISDRFEMTAWSKRRVICKAQRPWGGCSDGMNEDGLVASLTYGGGQAQGLGFSIILMLRYVLETCSCVKEAVEALSSIPVALSQNVALMDRTGAYATIFLGPGSAPKVTQDRTCTNHQEVVPHGTSSAIRQQTLIDALDDPEMTLPALVGRFFEPPLYSRQARSTTAYTAVYRPRQASVEYLWPGRTWKQGFEQFDEGIYTHDYGELT